MIKEKQLLDDALARKIISPAQFAQMDAMAEDTVNRNPDERFRIVSGFSEVFIFVGLVILLNAIRGIVSIIVPDLAVALVVTAGTAWIAASYFADRKRFMLPAIVGCLYAARYIGAAIFYMQVTGSHLRWNFDTPELIQLLPSLGAAFITLIAAAWRFRIPFLMLPIGILFAAIVTLSGHILHNSISYRLLLALCGITILGVALRFDLKDPHRVRRASDFAFWCYVIGSPLTIHPLFITFILDYHRGLGLGIAAMLIIFSLMVSVVALMINRRALILSTLIYLGVSVGSLTAQVTGATPMVALLPMLLIGLYVVGLGTAWRRVRRALMMRLTPRPWFSKLPPY